MTLIDLFHSFIDLYERDPFALEIALDEGTFAAVVEDELEYVPADEQVELLEASSRETRERIFKKTLISIGSDRQAYKSLRRQIGSSSAIDFEESREKLQQATSVPEILSALGLPEETSAEELKELFTRTAKRSEQIQLRRDSLVATLGRHKIEIEMLRFLVDQIPAVTRALEQLDDNDFSKQVPDYLRVAFRELHINAVLGNSGTALILCGAFLEGCLQDLLPTKATLRTAIEEAKYAGLLVDHQIRFAYQIADKRNALVHGKQRFDEILSDEMWGLISVTRRLVRDLYADRAD